MNAHFTQHGNRDFKTDQVIVCLGRHQKPEEQKQRVVHTVQIAQPDTLIIFSGFNDEAPQMYQIALDAGLSHDHPVILEQEACHTRQNSDLSASILSQLNICLKTVHVIVVTCSYHARRSYLSFRVDFTNVHIASPPFKSLWHRLYNYKEFVVQEIPRIIRYREQLHPELFSFRKIKIKGTFRATKYASPP